MPKAFLRKKRDLGGLTGVPSSLSVNISFKPVSNYSIPLTPFSKGEPTWVIVDALGLSEEEREEVYRAVCRLVWNRIRKAKSV
jgi:hypothetical protein